MSISANIADLFGGDPTRIAAQIITGIGFLGAAAVLHSHGFVLGLSTAATIWVVAGVGMALGSGLYSVAFFTTAMSLVILYLLSFIEDRLQGRKSYSYALVVTNLNQALASIDKVLQDCAVPSASFNFKKKAGYYRVWFRLVIPREANVRIIQRLSEVPEVTQVETGGSVREFAALTANKTDEGERRDDSIR
jgi:uncharacterized membrane protein YhiD involved in acid resistance